MKLGKVYYFEFCFYYYMIKFDIRKRWLQSIEVKLFCILTCRALFWHFDFLEIRPMNQQKTCSAVKYSISTILIDLIVYTNKQLWHIFTLLKSGASENIPKRDIEIHLRNHFHYFAISLFCEIIWQPPRPPWLPSAFY